MGLIEDIGKLCSVVALGTLAVLTVGAIGVLVFTLGEYLANGLMFVGVPPLAVVVCGAFLLFQNTR